MFKIHPHQSASRNLPKGLSDTKKKRRGWGRASPPRLEKYALAAHEERANRPALTPSISSPSRPPHDDMRATTCERRRRGRPRLSSPRPIVRPGRARLVPLADNSRDASELSPEAVHHHTCVTSHCLALPPALSLGPSKSPIPHPIPRHSPVTETNGATRPNLGGVGCHPATTTTTTPRHPGCDAGLGSALIWASDQWQWWDGRRWK